VFIRGFRFSRFSNCAFSRFPLTIRTLKVNSLSVEEIATQAANLYDRWQTMPAKKSGN
jgi:hypothetical protein